MKRFVFLAATAVTITTIMTGAACSSFETGSTEPTSNPTADGGSGGPTTNDGAGATDDGSTPTFLDGGALACPAGWFCDDFDNRTIAKTSDYAAATSAGGEAVTIVANGHGGSPAALEAKIVERPVGDHYVDIIRGNTPTPNSAFDFTIRFAAKAVIADGNIAGPRLRIRGVPTDGGAAVTEMSTYVEFQDTGKVKVTQICPSAALKCGNYTNLETLVASVSEWHVYELSGKVENNAAPPYGTLRFLVDNVQIGSTNIEAPLALGAGRDIHIGISYADKSAHATLTIDSVRLLVQER